VRDCNNDDQVHGISLCRLFDEKSYISVTDLRFDLRYVFKRIEI